MQMMNFDNLAASKSCYRNLTRLALKEEICELSFLGNSSLRTLFRMSPAILT